MNQAKLYSKFNDLQKRDANYVIDNYVRLIKWKRNGNILDVGCGDGDVTVQLLSKKIPENFDKLIGTDLSSEMIAFAKNRTDSNPRIRFQVMDIATDQVPADFEEEFDHIFSFYCLHWVEDQKRAFENMYEMLKPSGNVLLAFLANNPIFDIYESMGNSKKWSKYMGNFERFIGPYHHSKEPEKELEGLLRGVGFINRVCRVEKRSYVFQNFDTLENTLNAVNPFLCKIPDNEVADYNEDFLEEIRQLKSLKIEKYISNNNEEERVHMPYTLIVVLASKPA